jgi:hypothetical protein
MRIPTTPFAHQEAEAEEIRRQAFAVFVSEIGDWAAEGRGFGFVLGEIEAGYRAARAIPGHNPYGPGRFAYHAMLFAEGYGWPSTLRAIAQAMEADEALKRDADQRR